MAEKLNTKEANNETITDSERFEYSVAGLRLRRLNSDRKSVVDRINEAQDAIALHSKPETTTDQSSIDDDKDKVEESDTSDTSETGSGAEHTAEDIVNLIPENQTVTPEQIQALKDFINERKAMSTSDVDKKLEEIINPPKTPKSEDDSSTFPKDSPLHPNNWRGSYV